MAYAEVHWIGDDAQVVRNRREVHRLGEPLVFITVKQPALTSVPSENVPKNEK